MVYLVRRFFIFQVARELHLVFPSSSATAITISSMHLAAGGSLEARHKMKALAYAFVIAMCLRVVSQYAPGVLWVSSSLCSRLEELLLTQPHWKDWHMFTWLALSGISPKSTFAIESWGWFIEWTPAFIGSGFLVGMNVAVSFVFGSFLAW